MMLVSNFSGGITSAMATKLALTEYPDLKIVYIETGSHHSDMKRFVDDCENWFGKEIIRLQSRYADHFDVIKKERYVNGTRGAACTRLLKVRVRQEFESKNKVKGYIWGFDYSKNDIARFERIKTKYDEFEHYAPLIDRKINKNQAGGRFEFSKIKIPAMYELGYPHNNCVGCVKGGKSYWLMIQQDFPEVFKKMAELERELGHTCLKKQQYLDELKPLLKRVTLKGVLVPECDLFCHSDLLAA